MELRQRNQTKRSALVLLAALMGCGSAELAPPEYCDGEWVTVCAADACGDVCEPAPAPEPVPLHEDECNGQRVTVCDGSSCNEVCQPPLTTAIAEACTEECHGTLEPVACAWECARAKEE